MKSFKKLVALVMVLAMAMSMIACGNTKKTSDDTTDTPAVTDDTTTTDDVATDDTTEASPYTILTDADGNAYDLGGMEIVIGDWWTSDEATEPNNAYEEAREEYLDWIQETYNFTIKQVAISSWGDMPEDFVNFATTGGTENYIFVLRQGSELMSAIGSGLMYDLSTLDCIDFSESKWDAAVDAVGSVGDAQYVMRGIEHEPTVGIYFNKRLLQEAGIDSQTIYDYQANNEWTWDKFEEMLEAVQDDTDNDGVIDRYAMTNFTAGNLFPGAVFSNGGAWIGKDADGKFVNELESDATLDALNWSLDLVDKYEMVYPEDAAWDYTFTAFKNGEAVFCSGSAYQAGSDYAEMVDDFGFVCFPMGPNMDHYVNSATDNCYAIPACYDAQRAWNIAFAYNLYTDPVPGYEDYSAMKTNYYNSFRDTESVDESIVNMIANPVPNFSGCVAGIDLGPDILWGLSKDNTPAQAAEAIRNTWQSYIDTANGN